MKLALLGNPNSGKTTLFNALTGSRQHVGNFPGVTVEKKEGRVKGARGLTLVDLPGVASLTPYSLEERVTREYLLREKADAVLCVVDATQLERGLYLTLQLLEAGFAVVVALTMVDELTQNGGSVNAALLSRRLGAPVIPIHAAKGEGLAELLAQVKIASQSKPALPDPCTGDAHRALHAIAHLLEHHAAKHKLPARFLAAQLLLRDESLLSALRLTSGEQALLESIAAQLEAQVGQSREAVVATERYRFIEAACAGVVRTGAKKHANDLTAKLDAVLMHRVFALPVFLLIMAAIFLLTFGVAAPYLGGLCEQGIAALSSWLDALLRAGYVNTLVRSLLVDGVCAGVGAVLSFLPSILVLFFFLSILEDSGYMARVAFVTDRLLRKLGLSGRSIVPMLLGFGCTVPAVMATRTLSGERDRRLTIALLPFLSCSAKLPIYAVFAQAFFPDVAWLCITGLYLAGILLGVVYAFLLKNTAFRGKPIPFVLELPPYRFPTPRNVLMHIWEKAKGFLTKAFTVLFMASVVLWALRSFDAHLLPTTDASASLLAMLGQLIAPLFAPLGFGHWIPATALLTGVTAKEAVLSSLSVLLRTTSATPLQAMLPQLFTTASAVSFLTFTLLYMPCVAAVNTIRRELGAWRAAAYVLAQTLLAWGVAALAYRVALLLWP